MCVISSINEVGGLTNPFIFKQTIETERTEQISRSLVYSVPSSSVIKENKLSGVSKFNWLYIDRSWNLFYENLNIIQINASSWLRRLFEGGV